MVKKRLIFALLWQEGAYCLSRNFLLQEVGDLSWLEKHYNFRSIALSIDELIVVNTTRGSAKQTELFASHVKELVRGCFVPVAVGGGIRSAEDARLLLNSGADKLVLNTPLYTQHELVRTLARTYGSQCVVASIDYRRTPTGTAVYMNGGATKTDLSVGEAIRNAQDLGAGEIYLTSMDKDGTGQGYDLEILDVAAAEAEVPVIASGGVGDYEHLAAWLERPRALAASTANIFNFIGAGLVEARKHLDARGIPLARWSFVWGK